MAGVNELSQIRQAFRIPESIVIQTLPIQQIFKSKTGSAEKKFDIPQTDNSDPALYRSLLGTPVYADLEFLSDNYETKTKGLFRDTPNFKTASVLMTVSQGKKIIKTEIQGRDGTVKEYIGMDDFQIQINGIITGPNGHYPIDEVASLKQILDAPIPIPVASTYLNNIGINLIVIEGYELAQEAGGYSYQTFSITCCSDVPQELRLTNV